jgi:hypothetical protein
MSRNKQPISQSRSRSGQRGKIETDHVKVQGRIELGDVVAASAVALGAGGAGLLWFEPVTTVGGIALMAGGLAYFGVRYGGGRGT